MKTIIANKECKVKETNGKFFYWSPRAVRWMPVAKGKVIFE